MAKKIICESCGTIFPFDRAKDLDRCPVCDASFDEEDEDSMDNEEPEQEDMDESEEELMYFDEIMILEDRPENSGVITYCNECGQIDALDLDLFDKLVDKDYVLLKKDIAVKCRGCGKEHKPRKILYKRKDNYAPPLPRCPLCNSVMLKKIKTSSKFLAAATLGAFALPYNSKTFECQDCGYRF